MNAPRRPCIPGSLAELQENPANVLLQVISGSHAYGLATATSDRDERGIFALPTAAYMTLTPPVEHLQDERGDLVFTGIRKFLALASAGNPGALELLFAPPDTILRTAPAATQLLAARSLFVTARCFDSHVGYARTQIKRARGQNKWINNPQPEEPPSQEQFCHVIQGPWPGQQAAGTPPLRPRPLASSGIDLREHQCAALEHTPRTYRLYHLGPNAKGVFRDGNLVCDSIPLEAEFQRLVGLLIYDQPGYEKAKLDHANYWQWRATRNDARWKTQEAGETDYDAKNMMHTFRLLLSAISIFATGAPRIRFEGPDREFLLQVRAGRFAYPELLQRAEAMVLELEAVKDRKPLPAAPDEAAIDQLLQQITADFEANHV